MSGQRGYGRQHLDADHVAGLWELVAGEDLERVAVEQMPSGRLRVDGFAKGDGSFPSVRVTVNGIGEIRPRSDVADLTGGGTD